MKDRVYVTGVGMTPFGYWNAETVESLAQRAIVGALRDGQVDRSSIQEIYVANVYGGSLVGQRAAGPIGLSGVPITNVSNACASGGTAMRAGLHAIRSGRIDTALVVGVEQLTSLGRGSLPLDRSDIEVELGMQMPGLYAMRAQRYMALYDVDEEALASVSVKARKNGTRNPNAHYRQAITVEDVLDSRPIARPLTRLMCCPNSDGAAAVILSRRRPEQGVPVSVDASVLLSGTYGRGYRDLEYSSLAAAAADAAYSEAGTGPSDIDVAEVHDAFSIAELMYYEALGFCERGGAVDLLARGDTLPGGRTAVNVGGGLLCRGHPVGATGVAQVCEVVRQLRGEAGAMQLEGPRTALTQVTGGGISGYDHGACTVHILSTRS